MKRVLLLAIFIISVPALLFGDDKKKKTTKAPAKATKEAPAKAAVKENDNEIHWITNIDELQRKMQNNPKKVYVDVYTGWCGWCKKMDASTFTNTALIKYMNTNFYALRLDAERRDTIHFMGKDYYYDPQYKTNTFAMEMLKGRMSYPTAVFMLENFQSPTPVPGYMTVAQIEPILSYFGDNAYRHIAWEEYQKTYHPTWDHGQAPDMTPPPPHTAQ